jgi:hypothetical protein
MVSIINDIVNEKYKNKSFKKLLFLYNIMNKFNINQMTEIYKKIPEKYLLYLIKFRELLVSNFLFKIIGIKYHHTILYASNFIFLYLFHLFPLQFLCKLLSYFNIKVIYKTDGVYQLSGVKHNHILPVILLFEGRKSANKDDTTEDNKINLASLIKYYNCSIPLKVFISNNKLEDYKYIKLKFMSKGKFIEKFHVVKDFENLSIYHLFDLKTI